MEVSTVCTGWGGGCGKSWVAMARGLSRFLFAGFDGDRGVGGAGQVVLKRVKWRGVSDHMQIIDFIGFICLLRIALN